MYVYADNAASTRLSDSTEEVMEKCFFEIYGNPSGIHRSGRKAKSMLERARAEIARTIKAEPEGIYFTSGGTESDNWAVRIAESVGMKTGKKHIISTRIEHNAVRKPLENLKEKGFHITFIRPMANGIINPSDFEKAIRPDTVFASVMYANNVVGTIQPIREIGRICRKSGIIFHTDAVQAIGHIPVDVRAGYIDLLSASAHKFHGPKGTGFLYCGRPEIMEPFILGGGQERSMRSGTENVPGICGMSEALAESAENMAEESAYVKKLRKIIENTVYKIKGASINGSLKSRLPGNLNVSFADVSGQSLLKMLDAEGICVSAASACSAGSSEPNFVLESIGIPAEEAKNSIRITLSVYNTEDEARYICAKLKESVEKLQKLKREF